MKYFKVMYVDNGSYDVEFLRSDEKIHTCGEKYYYVFLATENEYKAYQKEQEEMGRWQPIRIRPNYCDTALGTRIRVGYAPEPNRRQRRELYKNNAYTNLFYEWLRYYEAD